MTKLLVHVLCIMLVIGVLTGVSLYYYNQFYKQVTSISKDITDSSLECIEILSYFTTPN